MGQTTGNNAWVNDIYLFEETDVVQGGTNGIDNVPLQGLADRSFWLRDQLGVMDRLRGNSQITGNSALTNAHSGKLIVATATGILNITLDDVANFKDGTIIPLSAFCNADSVVNILPQGGQGIFDLAGMGGLLSSMSMHNRELLTLVACTNHWKVYNKYGNFDCAGEEVKSRKIFGNVLPFKGQLLSRSLYPRLWKFVQTLTPGEEVISDELWLSDAFFYRGFYSLGNGTTTFRLPDERGMFDRMIDDGRGVDIGRFPNLPGGYEADELKSHNHRIKGIFNQGGYQGGSNDFFRARSVNALGNGDGFIEATGGTETRPKNIGKINFVKF
jgi:hypothetical protein